MYDDFFDTDHDGHLDAGEMAGYMDFVDYMNHDGVYSDGSGYDGDDEDSGYDDGSTYYGIDDELDDGSAGGSFYSGTYGTARTYGSAGTYSGASGSSARVGASGSVGAYTGSTRAGGPGGTTMAPRHITTLEELKAGQEQFYVSQGNEYLKSSCISGVISSLLLAISIWIIKCVSHQSLLFDCIGVLYFASIVFCIPFWVLFWKGLFYRIYKKENEAHIYVATPICTIAVVGYFVLLLFLSD